MIYRPTLHNLITRNCPGAATHYNNGTPQDRRIFAVGTAAHDILHAIGEGRDANETAERLMSRGRGGTDAEPPLPVDAVLQGRDIAEAWVAKHPLPQGDGVWFERRYAFDEDWQPCEWEDAAYRTSVDQVFTDAYEDEDGTYPLLVQADYKSSWAATEDELDTAQRRFQAVCAWLTAGPDVSGISLRIHNLRRRTTYTRDIWLTPENEEMLRQWQRDAEMVRRAGRVGTFSPGAGCMTCPYVLHCDAAAQEWGDTPEAIGKAWVIADAKAKALRARLKDWTESDHIDIGTHVIGKNQTVSRSPKEDAVFALVGAYAERLEVEVPTPVAEALKNLFAAVAVSRTALDKGARLLFPSRKDAKDRAAWVDALCEEEIGARWGVAEK